jgi:LysR family hydrogen peroxide-inducible transcriptional activator
MTLTELRYIVAVARERHFGRAAQTCFVSQPTLSVAVRHLEEELGVTLFERGRNEVVLTPVGERIVEQARRVLEEAATLKRIAESGRDQLSSPLRLGAIHTVGPYLLPHLIPILHERVPDMPLLVEENYTATLSERLKQGDLDVIIVSLPFEEPGTVVQSLYEEPFVVLLPASHPWNERDAVQIGDLARESVLLLGPGHCFRDQVLKVCPDCLQSAWNNGGLQKALEGSSLETIRHMVASGAGVTVLPCTAAAADQYSRRLLSIRRFADARPSRRVALASRKNFPRPQALEALRQAVLSCPLTCVEMLDLPTYG